MKRPHFALPEIYGEPLSFYEILSKLCQLLNVETDDRKNADDELQQNINSEANAREQADSTLQQNINTEATTREQVDTALRNELTEEATAREQADSTLQQNINTEATAREQADSTLQQNINTEATAREQADSTLQQNINTEATAREQVDTAIRNDLTEEANAREQADGTLQQNINNEKIRATNRENEIESSLTMHTQEAVNKWLNEHPEATTTVQDGSITEPKIHSEFLPHIKNEYVTPEMFGAVGDGVTDDSEAFKTACSYICPLVLLPGKTYLISKRIDVNSTSICGNNSTVYATPNEGSRRSVFEIKNENVRVTSITFISENKYRPSMGSYLDETGLSSNIIAISVNGNGCIIDNIKCKNIHWMVGITGSSENRIVRNITVRDCSCEDCANPIYAQYADGVNLENLNLHIQLDEGLTNRYHHMYFQSMCKNVNIVNCTFTGGNSNTSNIKIASDDYINYGVRICENFTITGCYFNSNASSILHLASAKQVLIKNCRFNISYVAAYLMICLKAYDVKLVNNDIIGGTINALYGVASTELNNAELGLFEIVGNNIRVNTYNLLLNISEECRFVQNYVVLTNKKYTNNIINKPYTIQTKFYIEGNVFIHNEVGNQAITVYNSDEATMIYIELINNVIKRLNKTNIAHGAIHGSSVKIRSCNNTLIGYDMTFATDFTGDKVTNNSDIYEVQTELIW